MAKTIVKRGQTYSKLAKELMIPEEDLKRANPGVKTLKTGQILNKPTNRFNGQGVTGGTNRGATFEAQPENKGGNVLPSLAPVQTNPFTGNAIQTGTATVSPSAPTRDFFPPIIGTITPNVQSGYSTAYPLQPSPRFGRPNPPATQLAPAASTWQGYPPVIKSNLPQQGGTPSTQGASYRDPRALNRGNQQVQRGNIPLTEKIPSGTSPKTVSGTAAPSVLPPRPDPNTQPYTGDPRDPNTQMWINYWNQAAILAAQNPEAYRAAMGIDNTPRVMTREEIRRMKQEQRRREAAKSAGDDVSYSSGDPGDFGNPYAYPELRRGIIWRTG